MAKITLPCMFVHLASSSNLKAVRVLESALDTKFNQGKEVIGGLFQNVEDKTYAGNSLSYCLRFLSNFLESPHEQEGVLNRILQVSKEVKDSELADGNVMGLTARFPNSFAWFGSPRKEGTFR